MTFDELQCLRIGEAVKCLGISYRVVEHFVGYRTYLATVNQDPPWNLWIYPDSARFLRWARRWKVDDAN